VFLALGIQHAMGVRRVMLPCPAVPHYSTLSHKWHVYREKDIEHKMCVFIVSATFV